MIIIPTVNPLKVNIASKTLFFVLFVFSIDAHTLIVIQGPANCGKTSLCRALNTLDNSYKIVSQDDINRKATYEICENIFPQEMAIIRKAVKYENMWQAIKCSNITFMPETTEQEKLLVSDAITRIQLFFDDPDHVQLWMAISKRVKYKVIDQLLFYAAANHNIILDSWSVTDWDNELEQMQECFDHIIKIATYCSLETAVNRWKKRNKEAQQSNNYEEKRFCAQMLKSFFGFVQPASMDQCGILTITKKDFDELIESAYHYIQNIEPKMHRKNPVFSYYEFTDEELLGFKQKMYEKFNFENVQEVKLIPCISYDSAFCTEGECSENAHTLLKTINFYGMP